MITFSCVSKLDGERYRVKEASFTVEEGEITVLLGSSGSGKTTLLRMINRLEEPSSGSITLDGIDISTLNPINLRRSIGYVVQGIGLFPHLTVVENVECAIRVRVGRSKRTRPLAEEMLARVHLDPVLYGARFPHELSGGQQQRVGVARALAGDPRYLLMDEPFGALDAVTRTSLQDELLRLREEHGKTIILVTHDIFEAIRIAHRCIVMNAGVVEQIGTIRELMQDPKTPFVEALIQKPLLQLQALR